MNKIIISYNKTASRDTKQYNSYREDNQPSKTMQFKNIYQKGSYYWIFYFLDLEKKKWKRNER